MSVIPGDNITYTATQFVGSDGEIIERTSLTADSLDFTPLASDIASQFGGAVGIGQFFEIFILNSSSQYTITLTSNTNFTMKPGPYDLIQPQTIKRYTIVVTSATECDIYNLDYNGTPLVTTQIVQVENAGDVVNTRLVLEDPAASTSSVNIIAPTPLSADYTLTLPFDDGDSGEVLTTDGSGNLSWSSALTNALTDSNIFVGNASNEATSVALSGDATISNTGVLTISDGSVTNAKLVNDSLGIAAGDGLSGGGSTALGTTTTLNVDSTVIRTFGNQIIVGEKTFNSDLIVGTTANLILNASTSGSLTLDTPATVTSYTFTFPDDSGSNGEFLSTNGSGVTSWVSLSDAGIRNLNGLTALTQNFVVGTAGTDFNIDSLNTTHTFNLPVASSTNTGKLSNTDWTTFNDKLTSSLPDTNIFVGSAGNVATAVAMSGDATIANTGALTIANDAITTPKIADGNVTNVKLANDSLGITAGDGLSGGGSVTLGTTTTLNVDATVVRTFGNQTIVGEKTFNSDVIIGTTANLLLEGSTAGTLTIDAPSSFTSYTLTLPPDGGSNGRVLTTDGSGVSTWQRPTILQYYDSAGGQDVSSTVRSITFAGSVILDSGGYTVTQVNGGPGVNNDYTYFTLLQAGRYEVAYWIQFESLNTSGAQRTKLTGRIETDPAGGTTFVEIVGSASSAYIREQNSTIVGYGCGKTFALDAAVNETLRIAFFKGSQTTTATSLADQSSVYIKFLGA